MEATTCGQLDQVHDDLQTVRFMLQWHITDRCNLRCEHCYQPGYTDSGLPFADLLGILEQFQQFIEGHRATGDPTARGYITVTGGEPFSRRDFPDLLRVFKARRDYFSFSVLTNGTLLDDVMIECLLDARPGYVQVSIDGTQATHDRIRGLGSFQKAISTLERMNAVGLRTMIAFTAHRANYREFINVARLGRRLGVARVWGDRLIPEGSGKHIEEQMLTVEETQEFFRIMKQARQEAEMEFPEGQTEISMHRALQFLVGDGHPYHCTAGDTLFTVMPNGDLFPCRRMPIRVGNLLEKPLSELYNCSLFMTLRDKSRVSSGCQSCSHNSTCHGGLKCLSYAVTGDPFTADPGCAHAQKEI
jgi:radical SAM protein with 4Fe4S-binding SPASM domain